MQTYYIYLLKGIVKVEAKNLQITQSGDLVMVNAENNAIVAFRASEWISVYPKNQLHLITFPLDVDDTPEVYVAKNTAKAKS